MLVGQERDDASAVELDKCGDTGSVLSFGILRGRAGERLRGIGLDVDDIGGGAIIGNESEFLLDTGILEERRGLTMGGRHGGAIRERIRLWLWLEVRDCAKQVSVMSEHDVTMEARVQ